MENIATIYYDELIKAELPEYVLTNFYCELFSKTQDKTTMLTFRKLTKLFGRERVHFGITRLGLSYSHIKDGAHLFNLLRKIIEGDHRNDMVGQKDSTIDLSSIIKERQLANKEAKENYDRDG